MADTGKTLFLVGDVARLTGLSEATIRHLIARELIPSRRLGRRIVILPEELQDSLRQLPRLAEHLEPRAAGTVPAA
jgi:Helix-turn-helix domain